MADLSTCTDCEGVVSKRAERCPHCGRNWPDADTRRTHAIFTVAAPLVSMLFGILVFMAIMGLL